MYISLVVLLDYLHVYVYIFISAFLLFFFHVYNYVKIENFNNLLKDFGKIFFGYFDLFLDRSMFFWEWCQRKV